MTLDEYLAQENLSTKGFAKLIGLTPEAVRLYRTGQRMPRKLLMTRIAQATDGKVRARDFYGETAA